MLLRFVLAIKIFALRVFMIILPAELAAKWSQRTPFYLWVSGYDDYIPATMEINLAIARSGKTVLPLTSDCLKSLMHERYQSVAKSYAVRFNDRVTILCRKRYEGTRASRVFSAAAIWTLL